MKKKLAVVLCGVAVCAGALLGSTLAHAADEPFNPDCHLDAINASIDSAVEQIKSSPAAGHAGGHYKRAIDDLQKVKNQLREGCRAWNKSLKKG